MKKIEKTRKNIGVRGLDEQTRKKLFNEFVDAGGQVLKDKEEKGLQDFDRELQKRYKQQLEQALKQKKSGQNKQETAYRKTSKKTGSDIKTKYNLSARPDAKNTGLFRMFLQRLHIRLRLLFMNIADFSGYYFTLKFLKGFDDEYKPSLLSVQTTYIDLFRQNTRTEQKILGQLDRIHPVYFEAIELLSNVFDRTLANEVMEHYYNFPDIPQETRDLREPLTNIFRKLYPLNPYREHILTGLERALSLQMRMEKKKSPFYSANKRKIKNDIYIIFNKLYPRLYWLMCHYEGRILLSDKDIEDTISIPTEYMPGKRKRSAKTFELPFSDAAQAKDTGEEQKEDNKDQEESIPDPVKKGFELMRKIDTAKSNETYRKNSIFKSVITKDKVFITNLLLDEFDREYSFILTTNKIKYNAISRSSENLDYKAAFVNIYNEIEKCKNRLRDYAGTLAAFEKLKQEKPVSSTQYIEYSNRLSALGEERKQAGLDARMYVKAFLEKLCKELKILIDDMDNAHNIVANPSDIIVFETEIEGEKKLNGADVHKAISFAYNYAMAFIYRLSPAGDLSGDPEFAEGGKIFFDSDIFKEDAATEKTAEEKETPKKESLLKELDDLV